MRRKRPTPWIHRWSRPLIGAIAFLGAAETAWLTAVKQMGNVAEICPTSGCNEVLNSEYAYVFGVPLTLFGLAAYLSMGVFALGPLAVRSKSNSSLRWELEDWTWLVLFVGSTAMACFSGYLMYLLAFELQDLCPYCIASAVFSFSIFGLTIKGRDWPDGGQLFFTGSVVGLITLVAAVGVHANVNTTTAGTASNVAANPNSGPAVTTSSGKAEMALARHLQNIDAKMYGAYWCPHCHEQKQLFGQEAMKLVDYVECDSQGANARPQLCEQANIRGFPSWKINGQVVQGVQPLERLAQLSGYDGPQNFQHEFPY
mgnify:CR=1 FL=1